MTGIQMIAAERERQVRIEGYDASHDDAHGVGQLGQAAAAYAYPHSVPTRDGRSVHKRVLWPFKDGWREHGQEQRVVELAKAGALIAAEIDRLQRKAAKLKALRTAALREALKGDEVYIVCRIGWDGSGMIAFGHAEDADEYAEHYLCAADPEPVKVLDRADARRLIEQEEGDG